MRMLWLYLLLLMPLSAGAFCFKEAGQRYKVDPLLLQAIGIQESGLRQGATNKNRDRHGNVISTDYGVMQINTINANRLVKMGLINQPDDLLKNACFNVQAGAWYWPNTYGCAATPGAAWDPTTPVSSYLQGRKPRGCGMPSASVCCTTASRPKAHPQPTWPSANNCVLTGM